jgi:intracellular septation protein
MRSYLTRHPLFTKAILRKLFLGSFLDFSPTLVFVIVFEVSDFFTATLWFIIATLIASLFAIKIEKRVPYFSLYISLITLLFGGSTLFFRDPHYVQMRDTFYDLVLGCTVLYTYLRGRLVFKSIFSHSIVMSDDSWHRLTHAWIFFFFFLATSNEIARRVFDQEGWVIFKVIMLFVTTAFGFWALFFFYAPREEDLSQKDSDKTAR